MEQGNGHDASKVATRSKPDTLCLVRLSRPVTLPAFTQCRAVVSTKLEGLILTEPKPDVQTKYGVRCVNSVHETAEGEDFDIILTNFTAKERKLPKGMVVS